MGDNKDKRIPVGIVVQKTILDKEGYIGKEVKKGVVSAVYKIAERYTQQRLQESVTVKGQERMGYKDKIMEYKIDKGEDGIYIQDLTREQEYNQEALDQGKTKEIQDTYTRVLNGEYKALKGEIRGQIENKEDIRKYIKKSVQESGMNRYRTSLVIVRVGGNLGKEEEEVIKQIEKMMYQTRLRELVLTRVDGGKEEYYLWRQLHIKRDGKISKEKGIIEKHRQNLKSYKVYGGEDLRESVRDVMRYTDKQVTPWGEPDVRLEQKGKEYLIEHFEITSSKVVLRGEDIDGEESLYEKIKKIIKEFFGIEEKEIGASTLEEYERELGKYKVDYSYENILEQLEDNIEAHYKEIERYKAGARTKDARVVFYIEDNTRCNYYKGNKVSFINDKRVQEYMRNKPEVDIWVITRKSDLLEDGEAGVYYTTIVDKSYLGKIPCVEGGLEDIFEESEPTVRQIGTYIETQVYIEKLSNWIMG